MNTEMSHVRKPWIAATLSLLCPGLGHLYCGRAGRGLVLYCVSILCGPIIILTAMFADLTPMLIAFFVTLLGSIVLMVWTVRDAKRIAQRMSGTEFQPQDFNHAGIYTLMASISVPYAIGLAFFLRATVVEAFVIPSRSMMPTLLPGDRVLVSKVGLASATFERGDLVVFRNPQNRQQKFIKRVIGLPGETVEIRDGKVLIDGKPLENAPAMIESWEKSGAATSAQVLIESAGHHKHTIQIDHPGSPVQAPPVKVADDSYFVLGDHRDMSHDSREVGTVPHGLMVGIVRCIYYPARSWQRFGAPR